MSTGLFMWAVLNGMFEMASYLINLDNQECAKALVAAELCTQISQSEITISENVSLRQRKKYRKISE